MPDGIFESVLRSCRALHGKARGTDKASQMASQIPSLQSAIFTCLRLRRVSWGIAGIPLQGPDCSRKLAPVISRTHLEALTILHVYTKVVLLTVDG